MNRLHEQGETAVYRRAGYLDRFAYLLWTSSDYGVPLVRVLALANELGPDEDFDGLINALEAE